MILTECLIVHLGILQIWSVNIGDVQHARCRSTSDQRSLSYAFDIFPKKSIPYHCCSVVWINIHMSVSEGYLHSFLYYLS